MLFANNINLINVKHTHTRREREREREREMIKHHLLQFIAGYVQG